MRNTLKLYKYCVPRRCYAKEVKIVKMKYLNVAEKNDAAKTIAGQLSNGTAKRREGMSVYNKIYEFETNVLGRKSKMVMTSVSGHLLTLEFLSSYRNWNNVNPESLFDAPVRKACSENFTAIKQTLEREVKSCQGLIVWTDCDREGENIGFQIIDVCRAIKPNITVYRAIFSEITGAAVKRALQNLTQPDKRQSDAVDVRSELDLRTGAAITRFQTMRLQRLFPEKISDKLISYGSCQIPTLGFVAERYKEIEAFVSEPFWKIKVIHTIDDLTVEFLWARNRLFDKQACEDYYLLVIANPTATVESVTVKPKSKWRPTPMDTVELEKLGSRKLKLPAKEVMTIAEKLYTKGIISYPRTETNMFSKEIDLKSLVEQHTGHGIWGSFAQRVAEWGPNPRNGSKSDQAHPPIHPTKMVNNLNGNEGRVYELICRHFLACVSKDAVGSETVVTIKIESEKFTATGLVIYERNYLDVYIYDKWNAKQIHNYEQGQRFEPTEITMPEGHTTAPPLLTEADLIALMEKHGIGTDATHAEHINTIKERGYIGVVDNGCLVPGVIGMGLYEGYDAMELALAKPVLRAQFEQDLKKICLGEKEPKTVLREQIAKYKDAYKQIMDKIAAMDEKMAQRLVETPVSSNNNNASIQSGTHQNHFQELFQCPKCSVAPLALKPKKNQTGFLIGCLNYPDCKNCIWWPDDCKEPIVLDETCSKCGSNIKLLKFKFSNVYHKTMFNTLSGWYKTCLRCDTQFRNTFNINLDSVKKVGPIVGDISSIPINYGSNTEATSKKSTTKTKNSKTTCSETENPERKTRKPSVKTMSSTSNQRKKTVPSNIRSYFTAAPKLTADEIVASELQDLPVDAFFDSNDGFDDLVLSSDLNTQSSKAVSTTVTTSTISTTASNTPAGNVFSDDLAAAFNDDDDDVFADFQWGSGNKKTAKENVGALTSTVTTGGRIDIDESFSEWLRDDNDTHDDDYVWGSAANNARIANVAHANKRQKIQEFETGNKENLTWGSSGASRSINSNLSNEVKCTGCHQVAKKLSVKKEGPNSGKQFYACSKSNPCKFFQWVDESSPQCMPDGSAGNSSWRLTDLEMPVRREETNCNCNKPANNLTVRKEGPNKGREFYACANRDQSCGFFQWAVEVESNGNAWRSSSRVNNSNTSNFDLRDCDLPDNGPAVHCNCNKLANSLTVRKDGPNKGRGFYACANRDKSCGFFQWANEMEVESERGWGTSTAASGSNFRPSISKKESTTSVDATTKARKCGLCRQEGHTRQKCPRKSEFEY